MTSLAGPLLIATLVVWSTGCDNRPSYDDGGIPGGSRSDADRAKAATEYDNSEFFQSDPMTDDASDSSDLGAGNSGQPLPLEVSVGQTKAMLDQNPETVLIDCREQDEYDTVKIDRAKLIPMSELKSRVGELSDVGSKPVIVHCHHGGRSLKVAKFLRENGVPQAQSMAGGIDAWATDIEPGLPRY